MVKRQNTLLFKRQSFLAFCCQFEHR